MVMREGEGGGRGRDGQSERGRGREREREGERRETERKTERMMGGGSENKGCSFQSRQLWWLESSLIVSSH